jgi:serine/threonine protein kinase
MEARSQMRLGGISEVAAELGVSRQRIGQLRSQPEFPDPVGEISAGPIWDLDAIERWNSSGLRRTSGRPSSSKKTVLGSRYVLDVEKIGSGGFADVYRASDISEDESSSHSVVAIKVLRDLTDEEVRRRFMRELRLVQSCQHPNIVPILDDGEDENGVIWYAMPLAKGSLADVGDRLVGNDEEILHIMNQLCAGLAYVHKKGIYHRDLKPANILRLETNLWAIADFGLAREAERTTTALTSTLQGVGTYFYAAPEVWRGAKYAEVPADIFGMGKILHQLATGELPLDRDGIEGRFRNVIRKATRSRAEDRYQSAGEMEADLKTLASAPEEWVSLADVVESLPNRLAADVADDSALDDLTELLGKPHGVVDVREAIPKMSRATIERLWETDPDAMRHLADRFANHAAFAQWTFSFCDTIADFFDRAVRVTKDDEILRDSVFALVQVGANQHRFHVRDVLAEILQRIRVPNAAMAASEGLKLADGDAVLWSVSEFVENSLHPIIRITMSDIRSTTSDDEDQRVGR